MNEVVPGLLIGDVNDARTFTEQLPADSISINVAIEHGLNLMRSIYVPFFLPLPQGGGVVVQATLEAVAELIDVYLKGNKRVLVNCNAGQERAPLAVVWFLYKKRGMSFDAAYDLVKQKRLETQDRRQWVSSFL